MLAKKKILNHSNHTYYFEKCCKISHTLDVKLKRYTQLFWKLCAMKFIGNLVFRKCSLAHAEAINTNVIYQVGNLKKSAAIKKNPVRKKKPK